MMNHNFEEFVGPDVFRVFDELLDFDAWIVGGLVRNYILQFPGYRDIDVVVGNDDYCHVEEVFDRVFCKYKINRHGNKRYNVSGDITMDFWSPDRFFGGFSNVIEVLENSDFTCNSVGFSFKNGFYYSGEACDDIVCKRLKPIPASWDSRTPSEYAYLIGRSCKFITNYGFFPVDLDRFRNAINKMDCDVLMNRYGFDRDYARKVILKF